MFLVIQMPFCDLRRFHSDLPNVVSKPSWPSPRTSEFIRRFGGVKARDLGRSTTNWEEGISEVSSTERHYVDASKYLKRTITKLTSSKLEVSTMVRFLRVVGDQDTLVRFEVGIEIKSDAALWYSRQNVNKLLSLIFSTQTFLARFDDGGSLKKYTFQSFAAALRRRYFTASEEHDGTGLPTPFASTLIKPLDWSMVLIMPGSSTFRWLQSKTPKYVRNGGFDLVMQRTPKFGNNPVCASFPIVGNYSRKNREDIRRFRLRYLRASSEVQALSLIANEVRSGDFKDFLELQSQASSPEAERLSSYVERSLNRIKDTVGHASGSPLNMLAGYSVQKNGHLSDDKIRNLVEILERVSSKRLVEKSITNIFERPVHIRQENKMSKFEFNAPAQGQFGDHGTANFGENILSGTANNEQMAKLTEELDNLLDQITDNHDGEADAAEAAVAIQAAKKAADEGDQPGVVASLKKAGGWILEKASLIGVPVAVDILKKELGGA